MQKEQTTLENILSAGKHEFMEKALFPAVATEFFKYRAAQQSKVDPKAADTENKAYPV